MNVYDFKNVIDEIYNIIVENVNIYCKEDIYNCIYENELDLLVALKFLLHNYTKLYKTHCNKLIPSNDTEEYIDFNKIMLEIKTGLKIYYEEKCISNLIEKSIVPYILTLFNMCCKNTGYNIICRYCTNNNEIIEMFAQDINDFCDTTNIPVLETRQLSKHTFMLLCFDTDIYKVNMSLSNTLKLTSTKIVDSLKTANISYWDDTLDIYRNCNIEIFSI